MDFSEWYDQQLLKFNIWSIRKSEKFYAVLRRGSLDVNWKNSTLMWKHDDQHLLKRPLVANPDPRRIAWNGLARRLQTNSSFPGRTTLLFSNHFLGNRDQDLAFLILYFLKPITATVLARLVTTALGFLTTPGWKKGFEIYTDFAFWLWLLVMVMVMVTMSLLCSQGEPGFLCQYTCLPPFYTWEISTTVDIWQQYYDDNDRVMMTMTKVVT